VISFPRGVERIVLRFRWAQDAERQRNPAAEHDQQHKILVGDRVGQWAEEHVGWPKLCGEICIGPKMKKVDRYMNEVRFKHEFRVPCKELEKRLPNVSFSCRDLEILVVLGQIDLVRISRRVAGQVFPGCGNSSSTALSYSAPYFSRHWGLN